MQSIYDRWPGRPLAVALALGLVLCVIARAAPTADLETGAGTGIGATAPDFTLASRDGTVSLSGLRGSVVYVDFWASWCAPCRRSFPWMNDLIGRHGDRGLEIVAINLDEDPGAADAFLDELAPRFRVAFDPQARSAERYGLIAMPGSWLIGPDGTILSTHVGFREKDKPAIEAAIVQALDALPRPAAAMPGSGKGS